MFTEQPAPPNPIVHVQPKQTEVATQVKTVVVEPVVNRVAPPESIAPQASVFQPVTEKPVVEKPAAEKPPVETYSNTSPPPSAPTPTPPSADVRPASSNGSEEAKARRRQEVEQALLELTNKARAKQKEEQQQQAAIEAAKYAESGDFKQAEQVVKNPTLPANLRDRLLKQVQAKKGQKNAIAARTSGKATTKGSPPSLNPSPNNQSTATEAYSPPGRGYAATPIIPLSEAELRLRYGKLIGRHLDFAYPLSAPAPVTSLFGWRVHPISGDSRFHRGIDLGAAYGTPVVAAKTGRVEVAGDMSGYGLTVMVRHNTSQQTLYAHLSQIYVKPGEMVKKGQLLGLVGSTGNSTGPHLHFELHQLTSEGWTALDPAIALHSAIALAENPSVPSLTRGKPQAFNLALSGLLDINSPLPVDFPLPFNPPRFFGVADRVSATLTRASEPFRPFTLLPTVLPELSWLVSPFVNNLLANNQTTPLPVVEEATSTVSFQPLPALANTLPTPTVFKATATEQPEVSQLRLATTKPLAVGVTVAEKLLDARLEAAKLLTVTPLRLPVTERLSNQGQLEALIPPKPRSSQILLPPAIASMQPQRHLDLSNRRVKPLHGG